MSSSPHESDHARRLGYEPDGHWEDIWVEVIQPTKGIRNVRAGLMSLAYWLAERRNDKGVLVLVSPSLGQTRIREERKLAEKVISRQIMDRIDLAVINEESDVLAEENYPTAFRNWLTKLAKAESGTGKARNSYYIILEILIHQWVMKKGPMTTAWLMHASGTSYPTVSNALERLEHVLKRNSDRKVELRYFPTDEWAKLVALSREVRNTIRFADKSHQPRSHGAHIRRLEKLRPGKVAIGGVSGAEHYHGEIDIIGYPTLNLTVHCPRGEPDLSFMKILDPALEPTRNPKAEANVVVHTLRRAESFFRQGGGSIPWADPVECLLDLHEAGLEAQAQEFFKALPVLKE